MKAEVISIGDELTSGERLDTNSRWLSQQLGDLGIRVLFHTTVGDDLEANVAAFHAALERVDVVVATGGLGPTADDLTRQSLAAVAGVDLVLDENVLEHIRSLFASRQREMPARNDIQAMFPSGSLVIPNPHGTAPGIDLRYPRAGQADSRAFALPGVPAEMKDMWAATVAPSISTMLGNQQHVIRHRRLKCFGVGESDLEQMLPDLIQRGRYPSVGITVHKATITLRVTAREETPEHCLAAMRSTLDSIHAHLGPLVFGDEDDELQHAVTRALERRQQTLYTVEWGSGGLLADWLTDTRSPAYAGGMVVNSVATASRFFGEQCATLPERDLARQFAKVSRERAQTDYTLVIGRYPEQPGGRVAFGLATPAGVEVKQVVYAGHPDILKERNIKQALDWLRLKLLTA